MPHSHTIARAICVALADVVRRAGGELAEDDLFCDAAAERHCDARLELLLRAV